MIVAGMILSAIFNGILWFGSIIYIAWMLISNELDYRRQKKELERWGR